MLPCFLELPLLLPPGTDLRLAFIGPDVPPALHGAARSWAGVPGGGALGVTLWHGTYDAVLDAWAASEATNDGGGGGGGGDKVVQEGGTVERPHLVFAPNAGLPAFASWLPTLARLAAAGGGNCSGSGGDTSSAPVPFLASDYCEEAAHQSLRLLDALAPGRANVRAELNPFRAPVPAAGHGTALPACANALFFGWV